MLKQMRRKFRFSTFNVEKKKVLQGLKQNSNQRTTMNWQVALSATKIK